MRRFDWDRDGWFILAVLVVALVLLAGRCNPATGAQRNAPPEPDCYVEWPAGVAVCE
jgi:hypothetical protein